MCRLERKRVTRESRGQIQQGMFSARANEVGFIGRCGTPRLVQSLWSFMSFMSFAFFIPFVDSAPATLAA
jgi:hypothetical protein